MKPLAPRTVATQKDHLRCTASALVRGGHDPSDIVDLAYLVRPAHVREALTFFLDRNGGQPNSYIGAIAYTLRTVAKYGVVLSDADRKEVERLYKKVAQQRHGMTEKNLARLRQLDDPAVRDRLLAFPTLRIREVLRKDSGGVAEALAVQAALATELWLFVPGRRHQSLAVPWQGRPSEACRDLARSGGPRSAAGHGHRAAPAFVPAHCRQAAARRASW
jgi:hypothetical protein